jgi:hypothetical protein
VHHEVQACVEVLHWAFAKPLHSVQPLLLLHVMTVPCLLAPTTTSFQTMGHVDVTSTVD